MKETIHIENVGSELQKIVNDLSIDGKRVVFLEMQDMGRFRFPQAVVAYSQHAFMKKSGNLMRNTSGFAENISGSNWRVGMRTRNVPYARIQHEGGQINRGRPIVPKRKKALSWPGAAHPVRRVNNPGFITATKYLLAPMQIESVNMLKRIKDKLRFRR